MLRPWLGPGNDPVPGLFLCGLWLGIVRRTGDLDNRQFRKSLDRKLLNEPLGMFAPFGRRDIVFADRLHERLAKRVEIEDGNIPTKHIRNMTAKAGASRERLQKQLMPGDAVHSMELDRRGEGLMSG